MKLSAQGVSPVPKLSLPLNCGFWPLSVQEISCVYIVYFQPPSLCGLVSVARTCDTRAIYAAERAYTVVKIHPERERYINY